MDTTNESQKFNDREKRPESFERDGKLMRLLKEKWPEYVIEILVIIFSITISFVLDEWRDNQRKKESEQAYLKGLASDLTADIDQLQEVIAETRQVLTRLDRLSGPTVSPGPDRTSFVDDVRFVMKRPRFISENATFLDLTSTGNMQQLSSMPLKRALFDYYKNYESNVLVENAELDAITEIIGPFLIRQIPLTGNGSGFDAGLSSSREFRNMLFLRRSNRQELLGNYERALKQARIILGRIRNQIQ
ncbi:hypothetical protein [Larkinella soli]|uniref:hypothetical protein n=1 Tax=Larkinella soli TaxID=1770527 RepID=UPI001E50C73F|nr:hypothetical protein [Larkinella soli]